VAARKKQAVSWVEGHRKQAKDNLAASRQKHYLPVLAAASRKATKQHVSTSQGNKQSTYMHDKNKQHVA